MAYRNTIISLVSLVALGTACSKAPSYDSNVPTAQTPAASAEGTDTTGADQTAAATENKTEEKAPDTTAANTPAAPAPAATPAPAAPGTTPPAAVKPDPAKQIANNGAAFSVVSVTDGVLEKNWGSSATAPFIAPVIVDAAGAIVKPVSAAQVVVKKPTAADPNTLLAADGTPFKAAGPAGLLVLCNDSTKNLRLHSGAGAGFAHGADIAPGACAAHTAISVNQAAFDTTKQGVTYDHNLNGKVNDITTINVYIKLQKMDAKGTLIP